MITLDSKGSRQLKLFIGSVQLSVFVSAADEEKTVKSLMAQKQPWVKVEQKSGNVIRIKTSEILAIETVSRTALSTLNSDTVAIKTLASFAGIHPITVSRKFADTLQETGTSGRFRRASKETALAVRAYLLQCSEKDPNIKIPSEDEFMALFGQADTDSNEN